MHLAETLDSLESQTFRDFEIVVVDDGSSDETPSILAARSERDSRYRILQGTGRDGIVGALNIGVEAARGEWIARVDADDASLPERLQEQVAYLERNPGISLLGTDYFRIGPDGRRRLRSPPRTHSLLRFRLLFGNVWSHSAMMVRRSILGSSPYRDWKHAEDYELWTRLLTEHRGATLSRPLAFVREHTDSTGARNRTEQLRMVSRVSARELGRWIPDVTAEEARSLKRARRKPSAVDDEETARRLLLAWVGLRDAPDIDAECLEPIRRRWIARYLSSRPVSRWRPLWRETLMVPTPAPALLLRALVFKFLARLGRKG